MKQCAKWYIYTQKTSFLANGASPKRLVYSIRKWACGTCYKNYYYNKIFIRSLFRAGFFSSHLFDPLGQVMTRIHLKLTHQRKFYAHDATKWSTQRLAIYSWLDRYFYLFIIIISIPQLPPSLVYNFSFFLHVSINVVVRGPMKPTQLIDVPH